MTISECCGSIIGLPFNNYKEGYRPWRWKRAEVDLVSKVQGRRILKKLVAQKIGKQFFCDLGNESRR